MSPTLALSAALVLAGVAVLAMPRLKAAIAGQAFAGQALTAMAPASAPDVAGVDDRQTMHALLDNWYALRSHPRLGKDSRASRALDDAVIRAITAWEAGGAPPADAAPTAPTVPPPGERFARLLNELVEKAARAVAPSPPAAGHGA